MTFYVSALTPAFAERAQRVVMPFACDASAAIGDVVYQSSTVDKKVDVATNNTNVAQVIGIIEDKPQATVANVLVIGFRGGFTGLTRGGRIFLSTAGSITTTKPATGYLHNLGVAISETEILFIANNIRVLQT